MFEEAISYIHREEDWRFFNNTVKKAKVMCHSTRFWHCNHNSNGYTARGYNKHTTKKEKET